MLEALRGFVGGWVAKIFLGVLIASFAVWGIAGEVFGPGSSNAVATVGETKVPPSRFVTSYYNALENVRRTFGRQPTRDQARVLGVEQTALAQIVSAATLDEYARRLGVTLSDEQLGQLIGQERSFQDAQGRFDRRRFQDAVRNARTSESAFIEDQNRAAVRAQIGSAAVAGDLVPSVFEKAASVHANETRVFELAELGPEQIGEIPAPTEAQLKSWFDDRLQRYRAPEYRSVALITLDPASLADPDSVDDARVEAEYESRLAAFTTPELRTIQQLPFPTREAAEEAKKALSEGATFETVRNEASIDADVANLGKLPRERVSDPVIAEAAFSLPLNEASEILDGRFGPVIVQVTEIEPEIVRPIEEVADELRRNLALQDASRRVGDLYNEIEDARAGGASVEEIAKANGLNVTTIDKLDAEGRGADGAALATPLPPAATLLREIFDADVDAPTNAVPIGSTGYVWFDVKNVEAARDRTLDEARIRAVADWTNRERAKLLDEAARKIVERVENGTSLREAAAEFSVPVMRTEPLTRNGDDPRLGRDGVEAGFAGPVGTAFVATPGPGRRTVGRVAEISAPEAAELAERQMELIRAGVAQDMLQQVIGRLQSEYGATVNQQLIEASLNQL